MLKVVMLDLGETLVSGESPLPFALEALTALRRFETSDGQPLERCLVSDYRMPTGAAGDTVKAITAEYVQLIDGAGIGRFFKPTSRRLTLSTHAGALKPNREVFVTALTRLAVPARLSQGLFVSENAAHVTAARGLGLKGLVFGQDAADWPEALLMIRRMVAPGSAVDTRLALAVAFTVMYGAKVTSVEGRPTATKAVARVRLPRRRQTDTVTVRFSADGRVASVGWPADASDHADEAAGFVASLRTHDQLAPRDGDLPPGATHRIDATKGRVTRSRFSAV